MDVTFAQVALLILSVLAVAVWGLVVLAKLLLSPPPAMHADR